MPATKTITKRQQLKLARTDFNAFAEYVGRDSETGKPIQQSALHIEWDRFIQHELPPALATHLKRKVRVIKTFVCSGKTTQMSILRTVWELGRNSDLKFLIVCNTFSVSVKVVAAVRAYIRSRRFAEVFPDTTIKHSSSSRLTLDQGGEVLCVGAFGLIPSLSDDLRFDRIVVDDIQDPDNAQDAETSKQLFLWYRMMVRSRSHCDTRELIFGTVYHARDFFSLVGGEQETYPVLTSSHKVNRPYTADEILQYMQELGPSEFQRRFMCEATAAPTRVAA